MSTAFPRALGLLAQETALIRLHDAIAAEVKKHHSSGAGRLSVRNMLMLLLVNEEPGKTIAHYTKARRVRAAHYHLGVLRERLYVRMMRNGSSYNHHITVRGLAVLRALEKSLEALEQPPVRVRQSGG